MFHFHENPRRIKTHLHAHKDSSDELRHGQSHLHARHAATDTDADSLASFSFDNHAEFALRHESGYLLKESGLTGLLPWRRKWFVLSASLLSYYDTRDDSKPKEVFDLSLLSVCATERPDKPFTFELREDTENGLVLSLAAESHDERHRWIDSIRANSLHQTRLKRAYQDRIDKLQDVIDKLRLEREKSEVERTITELHKQSGDDTTTLSVSDSLKLREAMGIIQQENARLRQEIQRLRLALSDQHTGTGTADANGATTAPPAATEANFTACATAAASADGGAIANDSETSELRRELAATRALLDRTKAERKLLKDECIRLRREEQRHRPATAESNGVAHSSSVG